MALDQMWLDLMTETVYAYAKTGDSGYGEQTYNAIARNGGAGFRARREGGIRSGGIQLLETSDGREIAGRVLFYTDSANDPILVTDKIVYGTTVFQILRVINEYDENGLHHQEILVS